MIIRTIRAQAGIQLLLQLLLLQLTLFPALCIYLAHLAHSRGATGRFVRVLPDGSAAPILFPLNLIWDHVAILVIPLDRTKLRCRSAMEARARRPLLAVHSPELQIGALRRPDDA